MTALPPAGSDCRRRNVDLLSGKQKLCGETYVQFGDYYLTECTGREMDAAGALYTLRAEARVWVDEDNTILPETLGRGTNHH